MRDLVPNDKEVTVSARKRVYRTSLTPPPVVDRRRDLARPADGRTRSLREALAADVRWELPWWKRWVIMQAIPLGFVGGLLGTVIILTLLPDFILAPAIGVLVGSLGGMICDQEAHSAYQLLADGTGTRLHETEIHLSNSALCLARVRHLTISEPLPPHAVERLPRTMQWLARHGGQLS